ncbi:hypothetical protein G6F31_015927 [Rhizopus arrhizus]|nr:hypothetical protein G6F31_015927 [Rhizopus arrhizus]
MQSASRRSGPEWPQVEEAPHAPPDFREPVGLEDQKAHDQQAEDDRAHGRHQPQRVAAHRQPANDQLEQFGHHRHEDCAKDGTQDRAHAAHDDGGQEEDRHDQRETLGCHHAKEVGPQAARHARVERRQAERQQLVAQQPDAQHLGRDVAVADGDEGPADARAKQVRRAQHHQHRPRPAGAQAAPASRRCRL